MLNPDFQDRLAKIKSQFEELQNCVLEEIETIEVIALAEAFEKKIRKSLGSLKKMYGGETETKQLCEELATFFLDCGQLHFAKDRDATLIVDKMYDCASRTLDNIIKTEDMERVLLATYHAWHWHSW